MIPLLSPIIFHHHILPLSILWKILKVHFELHGTQDMMKKIPFAAPLNLTYLGV